MARKGWNINTVKPGDKVSIVMHPMRDGTHAGSVVNVVLANGKTLWNAEIAEPAPIATCTRRFTDRSSAAQRLAAARFALPASPILTSLKKGSDPAALLASILYRR